MQFTVNKRDWHRLAWDENDNKTPDPFMFICAFFYFLHLKTFFVQSGGAAISASSANRPTLTTTTAAPRRSDEEPTCIDTHRCCTIFAEGAEGARECRRSQWMQMACKKSCGLCIDNRHEPRLLVSGRRVEFARSGRVFTVSNNNTATRRQAVGVISL